MRREYTVTQSEPIDPNILLWLDKTLTDKSSYHRVLTYSGDVIENHNDDHIYLNGGNSKSSPAAYIILGNNIGVGTGDFSVSYDVKILNAAGYDWSIMWSFGGSNWDGVLSIRFVSNGNSGWYSGGIKIMDSVRSYNTWYHYEFKRENGLFQLYIDNQLIGTSNWIVSYNFDGPAWWIGANQSYFSSNNEHMTGYIKNIIVRKL